MYMDMLFMCVFICIYIEVTTLSNEIESQELYLIFFITKGHSSFVSVISYCNQFSELFNNFRSISSQVCWSFLKYFIYLLSLFSELIRFCCSLPINRCFVLLIVVGWCCICVVYSLCWYTSHDVVVFLFLFLMHPLL